MRSTATRGSLPSKLMSAVVPLRPTPATRIGFNAIEPKSRTDRSESVDPGADLIDVRVSEHRLILRAVCKTSRSEERRVGKECRRRGGRDDGTEKTRRRETR